jgi:hypothetical protein
MINRYSSESKSGASQRKTQYYNFWQQLQLFYAYINSKNSMTLALTYIILNYSSI